jgi:hypothetical protein
MSRSIFASDGNDNERRIEARRNTWGGMYSNSEMGAETVSQGVYFGKIATVAVESKSSSRSC